MPILNCIGNDAIVTRHKDAPFRLPEPVRRRMAAADVPH